MAVIDRLRVSMYTMNQDKLKNIIDKYLSGKANKQERQMIDRWYQQAEENGNYPGKIDENLRIRLLFNINKGIASESNRIKKNSIKHSGLFKIAASLFLAVMISLYFYKEDKKDVKWINITANRGELKKLVLADRSLVWLNTSSSLKYSDKFNKNEREIWLDGEAYFDIKHDKSKPFIIHTRDLTINVLGTAFNINGYSDKNEVVVSVTRGKVGLTKKGDESAVFLTANQQANYTMKDQKIKKSEINAMNVAAWVNGEFVFKEMSFREIAKRLERRFDTNINFSSENIKNCLLTASFRKEASLNEILTILSEINKCEVTLDIANNKYLISGNGCN